MNLKYDLHGTFVEACNCTVICPCWVEDEPTEQFCAGLFAWAFADGSTIGGQDVGGHALVSVTIHGDARRGSGSESAVFVDDHVRPQVADADVEVGNASGGYQVSVTSSEGSSFLRAIGAPTHFDDNANPLTLQHTALHTELGLGDQPVIAHTSQELMIDVSALPGAPVEEINRSGMTGSFRYVSSGAEDDDDK